LIRRLSDSLSEMAAVPDNLALPSQADSMFSSLNAPRQLGVYTRASALAIRFKADWEIWSNPMPSVVLQAFEAEAGTILCLLHFNVG
jgi:hypothetical protein